MYDTDLVPDPHFIHNLFCALFRLIPGVVCCGVARGTVKHQNQIDALIRNVCVEVFDARNISDFPGFRRIIGHIGRIVVIEQRSLTDFTRLNQPVHRLILVVVPHLVRVVRDIIVVIVDISQTADMAYFVGGDILNIQFAGDITIHRPSHRNACIVFNICIIGDVRIRDHTRDGVIPHPGGSDDVIIQFGRGPVRHPNVVVLTIRIAAPLIRICRRCSQGKAQFGKRVPCSIA